ncbi:hypothetical protein P153DRAFT_365104 [Dothidotthia symphoricarpi CBS 119687]|uniref:F-box domain-containing protein n=1 Tax=Dothidotthia symphoricarpi CBS 119687 TaxID=1392245 RepID=A0A6A6AHQ3_9PLEO|nr:uncharacterized protein P153DRAFT_365104 [Dothidotthia symphoricarpi CBS 119687]KAF2131522.1 hypothetical protein P153DRAFT_365104 [Dothidotthia symphoricarpi CBS 119687]
MPRVWWSYAAILLFVVSSFSAGEYKAGLCFISPSSSKRSAARSVQMTSILSCSCVPASVQFSNPIESTKPIHGDEFHVQPSSNLATRPPHTASERPPPCVSTYFDTLSRCSYSQSKLETLPIEIVNQILSYLTHPRSRLPGLTETQSAHDFPRQTKFDIKSREDLTTRPDTDRWAADLFSWTALCHPFNSLAHTSKRCNELVESYSSHLVRSCNKFNLPFAHFDKHGSRCVYPDMSQIIYRRLWLQHAPRICIFCYAVLDCYPFPLVKRVIAACEDCFLRQTLTVDEVEHQYHISQATTLASPYIRGSPGSIWVLRIDVENLALQLYGTRAFHSAHVEQFGKPCSICAITRFTSEFRVSKAKSVSKTLRRHASLKRKGASRTSRCF